MYKNAISCGSASPLVSDAPKNNRDRFSRDETQMSLVVRKQVFGVSDQVRHKPGCTATKDGWGHEISDLESRGIVVLRL